MRALLPQLRSRQRGVTLIELAIVIALAGILGAIIVNFMMPVRSYIDTTRRAGMADTADTALRRIGRDLRLALPNSVRVGGGGKYVEFLLVRTGGRYLSEVGDVTSGTCDDGAGGTAANDVLTFGATDFCFATIGKIPDFTSIATGASGDFVVVFNLPSGTGAVANANAYEFAATGGNKARISDKYPGTGQDRIRFNNGGSGHTFTYESPGNRFFIVEGPVSYGCAGGVLRRYWGYGITPAFDTTPPSGGSSAIIATGVADCTFTYDSNLASSVATQGAGLVTMNLQLQMQDSKGATETVSLYHAVHVNNVP